MLDIVVGYSKYSGKFVDIPVMGNDGYSKTFGYCMDDDIPSFKIFDYSENPKPSNPRMFPMRIQNQNGGYLDPMVAKVFRAMSEVSSPKFIPRSSLSFQ